VRIKGGSQHGSPRHSGNDFMRVNGVNLAWSDEDFDVVDVRRGCW
jgi:hypothetical protein